MGRVLSLEEHASVLDWGERFRGVGPIQFGASIGRSLREGASVELRNYWNLACLSRAGSKRPE